MKKKIIITLTAAAFSLTVFAQTEFSGKWQFQSQESISGKLYGNGSPKSANISLKGSDLTFLKVTDSGNGQESTIIETVEINGKLFETVTATKRKKTIALKKDAGKLIESAVIYNATDSTKTDRKVTDTWSIDNGLLVLDRKDENLTNGETWESKATYVKN